jgi:hypothetical protein
LKMLTHTGIGLWAVATLIASIALPIYALKYERLKGFRTRSRILIQFLFTGQPLVWPPEAREE